MSKQPCFMWNNSNLCLLSIYTADEIADVHRVLDAILKNWII